MSRERERAGARLISVASVLALVTVGCAAATVRDDASDGSAPTISPTASTAPTASDDPPGSTTAAPPAVPASTTVEIPPGPVAVSGTVVDPDGLALPGATVAIPEEERSVSTGADGRFMLEAEPGTILSIRAPGRWPTTVEVRAGPDGGLVDDLTVSLEPLVVRGIRVSRPVAGDPDRYSALLSQIEPTVVNALVFDTKDETGTVLYRTEVEAAAALGAVDPVYRPEELLAQAEERGLYTITRIVTFEDRVWAGADAEAKLAGAWVDATDEANWAYPLGLATEACRLGFDEIQFDYVRYPAGRTAQAVVGRIPATGAGRTAVIAGFLAEARSRLAPLGCGVSAAVFGIVASSPTDEGIGQSLEALTPHLDAVSPMVYPSHYGPGWLGFADPNDHPGPVVADALDDGFPRMVETTTMRPWLQAFYYDGSQIGAQIAEAEARGAGWLLWNASGRYLDGWLPAR